MEEGSQQSSYSTFTSPTQNRRSGKNRKVLLLIALIIVLGLVAFGISKLIGNKGVDSTLNATSPTPTTTPTTTPTPTETNGTPTPTTKLTPTPTKTAVVATKNLSIQVLNGAGVVGAGKKAADFLTGLGYNVVSTGNADNFDYQQSVIQIKAGKASALSTLKKDLSANYTIGSTSTDLSASTSADAVFIIGKE